MAEKRTKESEENKIGEYPFPAIVEIEQTLLIVGKKYRTLEEQRK